MEEGLAIQEFLKRNPLKHKILKFLACLKKRGYLTHPQDEEVLNWDGWTLLTERTPKQSCRQFLSFLFNIDGKTIAKDLSRKKLKTLYKKNRVAKSYHHYLDSRSIPGSGTILSSGWYGRLKDDGTPSIFDFGNTYSLMPYYDD